jgi:cytochrome c oxidase cbb3-type subunit III
MASRRHLIGAGLLACAWLATLTFAQAQAPAQRQPPRTLGDSPASQRPPATTTPQTYPAAQIEAGGTRFAAQCGFCHGRDATGGESGPDLTRSTLVAEDVRGDKIAPVVRSGRPDKGMPPFTLANAEMMEIVAFIHDAKVKAAALGGGRRSVDVADLQTGDVEAGKAYFNGAGGCVTCHGPTTTIGTVASRYQGLALLQRMLYPASGGRGSGPPPAPPVFTVTTARGDAFTGKLAYRDEFTITLVDDDGWTRSWPIKAVKISGDEPLRAHADQLGKYTDKDMHDVFAYLQTLK